MEVPSWSGCSQPLHPSLISPVHAWVPAMCPVTLNLHALSRCSLYLKNYTPSLLFFLVKASSVFQIQPCHHLLPDPWFPQHLGLDISLPSSWKARAVFCISVSLVSLSSSWTGLRKACGVNGWTHEVDILFSLSKKKWMDKSHYTLLRVLDCGWAKVLPL